MAKRENPIYYTEDQLDDLERIFKPLRVVKDTTLSEVMLSTGEQNVLEHIRRHTRRFRSGGLPNDPNGRQAAG